MFKEQLHTAFDNISPSPELLDRVSAMMNEEVRKKKAPLKLNVVKYGGIAAALALAAGGTFLVINNSNGGIETSESAAAEKSEMMTVGQESYDSADAGGANEDNAYAAEEMTEMAAEATSTAAERKTMSDETEGGFVNAENAEENEEMFIMSLPSDDNDSEPVDENRDTDSGNADAYAEAESFSNNDEGEVPAVSQYSVNPDTDDNVSESKAEAADNGVSGSPETESAAETETAAVTSTDPMTGLMATDPFINGYSWSLYAIPDQLKDLVDGVMAVNDDGDVIYGEKWKEYIAAVYPGADSVTGIEDDLNIYTFIKYFDVPAEDARAALYNAADTGKGSIGGITLTREEADIILTMDIEKLTETFATREAIVKGTKIYTPLWLLKHEFDEYAAAGITKDDILAKYDLLTTMADRYSDAVIGEDTQAELTAKLDKYLNS